MESKLKGVWDHDFICKGGDHKPKENKYGVKWCSICGRLFPTVSPNMKK